MRPLGGSVAAGPLPNPLYATCSHDEVASASRRPPHGGEQRDESIRILSHGPSWPSAGKEIEVNRLSAPTRTRHNGEPRPVRIPHHIENALVALFRLIEDLQHAEGRWIKPAAQPASERAPGPLDRPHGRLSSGISRRGSVSARPTQEAKGFSGAPSGSASMKPPVRLTATRANSPLGSRR